MKRWTAFFLALMLVFSMATVASADEEGGENNPALTLVGGPGSITITDVALKAETDDEGNTTYTVPSSYTVYRILELESYNDTNGSYLYVVAPGWEDFLSFEMEDGQGNTKKVSDYLTRNEGGYVVWVEVQGENLKTRAAELSQLAYQYVKTTSNSLPQRTGFSKVADAPITTNPVTNLPVSSIEMTNLPLGYYFVDSNAGVLCGLTTAAPGASFVAKNVPPTLDKRVKEDDTSSGAQYGNSNTAEIGQIVEYDVTIKVHAGAENYVLHDVMSDGLEFVGVTEIRHEQFGKEPELLKEGTHYTVKTSGTCDKGCDMEVVFLEAFHNHVEDGDTVVVLYTARVTPEATYIDNSANVNDVWLHYGENSETAHDTVVTNTYAIELAKTTSLTNMLPGAVFRLYKAGTTADQMVQQKDTNAEEDAKNPEKEIPVDAAIWLVDTGEVTADKQYPIYRLALLDEEGNPAEENAFQKMEIGATGVIRIVGLDSDHYILKETRNPDGYNILTDPETIVVTGNHFLQYDSVTGKPTTGSGFQIVNKEGSILPETGARGTTMFLIFGSFVVLATGVLLVTKKRMSMIED